MNNTVRNINWGLAKATSTIGYHLWQNTLANNRVYYADLKATSNSPMTRWHASAMTAGLTGALYLRQCTARPNLDRATGTGWDNAYPPGENPSTDSTHIPDIDRLDLGNMHRALAKRMGGSDAAVLAVHPLFFAVRMMRHIAVGAITGIGFVGGCIAGAFRGALSNKNTSDGSYPIKVSRTRLVAHATAQG